MSTKKTAMMMSAVLAAGEGERDPQELIRRVESSRDGGIGSWSPDGPTYFHKHRGVGYTKKFITNRQRTKNKVARKQRRINRRKKK